MDDYDNWTTATYGLKVILFNSLQIPTGRKDILMILTIPLVMVVVGKVGKLG